MNKLLATLLLVFAPLAMAAPAEVKVGLYVMSLYDINTASGTFGADLWIWGTGSKPGYDLRKSREFLNARDLASLASDNTSSAGKVWTTEKVRGVFLHDYDVRDFPFDKHTLEIPVEESLLQSSELKFIADTEGSKIDSRVKPNGWKIKSFEIANLEHDYPTSFGSPGGEKTSAYSQVVARITLQRDGLGTFFKITLGLYVALAIALLSLLMKTDSGDIFSSRVSLLVGMLFAALLNQQASESLRGGFSPSTLVDKLHLVGFAFIFAAIIFTLLSRRLSDSNRLKVAVIFDRVTLVGFLALYVLINWFLIASSLD